MNCAVDDLARLIAQDLELYTQSVENAVEDTILQVTEESLQSVRSSPAIQHMAEYKKSFRARDVYKSRGTRKGYIRMVITSTQYRISHLLEHSHALRGGGRTRAFPHWENGQSVADTLPERIRTAIQGAGR